MVKRIDGRKPDELRTIKIKRGFQKFALGSCLIEVGNTQVVCAASLEEHVPPFLKGTGKGWVTAEYGMLPASCTERIRREASKGRLSGRTHEIQRLIGRSLRAVVDLRRLGERAIWVDCDVLQGDGGTRTASITGSFIALADALKKLNREGKIDGIPLRDYVAAVSVGMVDGAAILDLCYEEDSRAEVDMNVVMTGSKRLVEVQGTAEHKPFSQAELNKLLRLAQKGIHDLVAVQKRFVTLSS
ncbi:MAG: ribonuclease PH [Omnitrophica bacterium RIFCSPLOWO2_01_FULL_50_24]|nr:MAG: ribonuclease PH [Omnitrophica bacterium RIFCSPLOWO2_01_FULL_50_24]